MVNKIGIVSGYRNLKREAVKPRILIRFGNCYYGKGTAAV